jgi:flavin-binding protein dodecin
MSSALVRHRGGCRSKGGGDSAGSLRDLRVAEVTKMDMKVDNGKVTTFRTRVALSFKYEND